MDLSSTPDSKVSPPKAARLPVYGIDLVRFFAASAVLAFHFGFKPFGTPEGSTLNALLHSPPLIPSGAFLTWCGWVGVQIFFVISGLVITYSAQGATPRSFAIGRVSRLWPAMAICATIISILSIAFWDAPIGNEALLYVKSLVFFPVGPWVSGQIWTLPVEIIFYILVLIVIMLGRVAWLEPLAWCLGLVSFMFWTLLSLDAFPEPTIAHMSLLLLRHGGYFSIGMLIAIIFASDAKPGRLIIVALDLISAYHEIVYTAGKELGGQAAHFSAVQPYLIWLGATALLCLSLAWQKAIAARIGGFAPTLRAVGLMTYPLYLVHVQTGGLVLVALIKNGAPLWLAVCCGYLTAVAAAFVIVTWIEPPLARAVRKALNKLPQVSLRRSAVRG